MSLADHFDTLAAYGATAVRICPVEGEPEDLMSEGGRLERAFEALGRRPLMEVLADPGVAEVVLADGDLQIGGRRQGARAQITVRWGERVVVNEAIPLPPRSRPVTDGAGFVFRPAGSPVPRDQALAALDRPVVAVRDLDGALQYHHDGFYGPGQGQLPVVGWVPPLGPQDLGSSRFREQFGLRWAYVAGAMAGGIASADLVVAMSNAGLLGFFGAGGLPLDAVDRALEVLQREARGAWGANLLHNPDHPSVEEDTVDRFLERGVQLVSASAFMQLTPAVVRYRLHGIRREPDGTIHCPHHVFAKVSRTEVATHFLQPAPERILRQLVERGALRPEQARLAEEVPIASAITAEADSGGHTDHRPLPVLLPTLLDLRDRLARPDFPVYVGAAGGLGTPRALWGAFAMGADYVLTGSINQATREAGTSDTVKQMLAEASWTDVASGPAPDMFEIGATVQVLARGSMYAKRAQRLYDLYRTIGDLDALPPKEKDRLERQIFKRPLEEVWEETRQYWQQRDPAQVERAERNPRHKMALTFRWYLGMSSRWARTGDPDRKRDYQVWCGPAMGALNAWLPADHPLRPWKERSVVELASLLMHGAALEARRCRLP